MVCTCSVRGRLKEKQCHYSHRWSIVCSRDGLFGRITILRRRTRQLTPSSCSLLSLVLSIASPSKHSHPYVGGGRETAANRPGSEMSPGCGFPRSAGSDRHSYAEKTSASTWSPNGSKLTPKRSDHEFCIGSPALAVCV